MEMNANSLATIVFTVSLQRLPRITQRILKQISPMPWHPGARHSARVSVTLFLKKIVILSEISTMQSKQANIGWKKMCDTQ